MTKKKMTFQQAMRRLDEIVTLLNSKDLELEEAMDLFVEGSKLSSQCESQLKEFESKMNQVMKQENSNAEE
ncbi:MAG: exodeoxyribonuclease VII small subunit [Erysipelotrichaceae bacterium]|jgi:exodeoxyribonuclease VII small subunit|nr:exodeoxyribonuclease VII small subunit [Erysipelotrichaceae bacterium]